MENEFERAILFLSKPCSECGNLPVFNYDYVEKTLQLKCCYFATPKINYMSASGEVAQTIANFWNKGLKNSNEQNNN